MLNYQRVPLFLGNPPSHSEIECHGRASHDWMRNIDHKMHHGVEKTLVLIAV